MKRILIFSLAYFPKHIGGAEIAIKEITDRIDSKEIEFHLVTNRFDSTLPETEKIGNVLIHRIGFARKEPTMEDLRKFPLHLNKFLFQFTATLKALSLHRQYKYDAIWAMMAHSTGVPAVLFKMIYPKVAYILTLQEGDPVDYIKKKLRPLSPLFVRAFTMADTVQVISVFLGRWARDMGFQGHLEIIPNAVNVNHFSQSYSESELTLLREKLGKSSDEVYLITTSRLVKKNAVDDIIKSLKHLSENVSLIILGIGPDETKLLQLAKDEAVDGRVQFLGEVDHNEMPKYLRVSDIFIRPSLSEGMGISFIEAMAADLPVIATQEGGIADFLFDPDRNPDKKPTGLAVSVRDPKEIAQQVNRYLKDKMLRDEIVTNARKLVREKYDWNLIAHDMEDKVFKPLLYGV